MGIFLDNRPMHVGANRYGKARVRLVKVIKNGSRHSIVNYTVQVLLEGDFATSFSKGDNSLVVPTDTTKNIIFSLAKRDFSTPEEYALILGDHFLQSYSQVEKVLVDVVETPWQRMNVHGKEHDYSFEKVGAEKRCVRLEKTRSNTQLFGGIQDHVVLKTTGSGFEGFHRCQYTVLPETTERILATNVSGWWQFTKTEGVDFTRVYHSIREIVNEKFATLYSPSVQATLWYIAEDALGRFDSIDNISFSLPNLHHWEVDTSRFGLSNDHDIFIAVDEPHGVIEATISRDEVSPRSRL